MATMTNLERCNQSKRSLANVLNYLSLIDHRALNLIDWDAWLESKDKEPTFPTAIKAKYTTTSKRDKWYDCLVLKTWRGPKFDKYALLWVSFGKEHGTIVVNERNIKYD